MNFDRAICTAYKSGTPIAEICERFGIYRARLYKLVREMDIPHRNVAYRNRQPTEFMLLRAKRDAAIAKERYRGVSVARLAKKYGISEMRIRQIMYKAAAVCP